jgi:hypothetical protein
VVDLDSAMPEFTPDGKWERLRTQEKVVTSPLDNTWLSHSIVQPTKHEYTNAGYLYSPYQTRAVCTVLDRLRLTWLQILARLPITPLLYFCFLK